jgi:uroporphyrinogen-III synthase
MRPAILITRPAEDATETASIVEAAGFQAVVSPVIKINDTYVTLPDPSVCQALIFSSANGVKAFARRKPGHAFLSKPVFVVGNHTAAAARDAGFLNVRNAAGTMKDLVALIKWQMSPPVRILHLRGQDVREDPADLLPRSEGWAIDGITLYSADPAQTLTPEASRAVESKAVEAVMFYSARSADLFGQACPQGDFTRVKALCLADSVVESLDIKKWAEIRIAPHPDQSGMTALISALKIEDQKTEDQKKTKGQKMQTNQTSDDDANALTNAEMVIERFGGIRPMATKMAIPVTTVQGWKKRNVIPGNRRDDVLSAARIHNIDLSDVVANQNMSGDRSEFSGFLDAADRAANPALERVHAQALREPAITREDMMREIKKSETITIRKSVVASASLVFVFVVVAGLLIAVGKQRLHKDEERIAVIEQQMPEAPKGPSFFTRMMDELRGRIDAVEASVNNIKGQAESAAGELGAGSLVNRVTTIEETLKGLTNTNPDLMSVASKLGNVTQMQGAVTDLKGLVAGLQGRMDTMDTELAKQQESNTALGQALEGVSPKQLKAAAMLIGLNQFRDSLNRDVPFADDLAMMQGMVGDQDPELNEAIKQLAPYAEKGVLSPSGLSDQLKGLTGDIVVASVQGQDVSVQDKAMARLQKLVSIEKDGKPVMGSPAQATVADAQKMLDDGDVEGAMKQLQTLKGPARDKAQPIIDQGQITLLAQKVQGMLSSNVIGQIKSVGASAPLTAKSGIGGMMGPIMNSMPKVE